MKNFVSTVLSRLIVLFLIPLFFTGCNKPEDYIVYSQPYFQADEYVYLESLPSSVSLVLGKSIFIENGMSTFSFIGITEDNGTNSAIEIMVDYGGMSNVIVLNTNNSPVSYNLENDYYHKIHLVRLDFINGTYQIIFTYGKRGGRL